eukprot:52510_1
MGCCSSHDTDENTSLLKGTVNDSTNTSVTSSSAANRERSRSTYIDKPTCKCGASMCLTELQCCYLTDDGGNYNQTIDCAECMLGMDESTTLLWHCMNKHDYKYDLCIDCAEKLYEDEMKNTDEKQHDKYHIFDTQYNIENQINWNKLYEFYKDDGKVIPVNNEINKYIA